jgi:hypothetical protein
VVAVWEDHAAEVTKIHLMYGHTAETSTSAFHVNEAIGRLLNPPPGPEKVVNAPPPKPDVGPVRHRGL